MFSSGSLGGDVYLSGTTTGFADNSSGSCGGSGGADLVYSFTTSATLDLTAYLYSYGTLQPVLYLRQSNCSTGTQAGCSAATYTGGTASLNLAGLAPGTYYLWADGTSGTGGSFDLEAHLVTTNVGVAGDTCASPKSLTFSAGSAYDSADTTSATADYSTPGSGCNSTGNDIVYVFTTTSTQKFTASMSGSFYPALYLRSGSCTSGADLACNTTLNTNPATLTILALPPGTYYLFADSYSTSYYGTYALTATLTAPATDGGSITDGGGGGGLGDTCSNPKPLTLTTGSFLADGGYSLTATSSGDTTGMADNNSTSCSTSGPDMVFSFTFSGGPRSLIATVTPTTGWDPGISIRGPGSCTGTNLGCVDSVGSGSSETISLASVIAGTYYVWIDGYVASTAGPFSLNVTLQ